MKNNSAYIAWGENTMLLCAYGKTPGKALKKLSALIDECIAYNKDTLVLGMNCHYDEDGIFNVNATISSI